MNKVKMFYQFVIPSIMAFALSGVYTIVDGFFVGNSLGDNGLAAINLGFPLSAFMQAVGTGIGLSSAIRFTILRGQKRHGEDKECFASTIFLLGIVSILLMILIFAFLSPLLSMLGAEGTLYHLTAEYVRIIVLGAAFQIFSTGLVPFIRNLGGSAYAMGSMIAGFLTNIVLDYIFVWVYGYGMAGAAWATIIGQTVTMLATIIYLIRKKVGFCVPKWGKMLSSFAALLKVAVAPFGLTFSPQITTILMNRFLVNYGGEQPVAVYGCIAYITAITYLLLQGVGDGSQPLVSRYYSENNFPVMREIRKYAYLTSFGVSIVCLAGFFLARNHVGILFGASDETNQTVGQYLPLFLIALVFLSYVRITTAFLYATEKSVLSYVLVYAEPITIFFFLLLLPHIFSLGILGVWMAIPLAQIVTWIISLFIRHKADKQLFASNSQWEEIEA